MLQNLKNKMAAMAHGGVGLTPTFKVIMLGSSSVGKSSII